MDITKIKLSALWIVVMFNITFADIVGFIHPGALEKIIEGDFGFSITPEILLLFSVFLEIPIAMIFLSLVLSDRMSRWLNTFAVAFTILFVVGGGSATYSYCFFAAAEIVCMLVILWFVWRRGGPEPVSIKHG